MTMGLASDLLRGVLDLYRTDFAEIIEFKP